MIQRLFIAEKPSLGKAIAAELGVTQTRQGIKETTVVQPVTDSGLETVKIEETLVPLREKSPSSTKPTKTCLLYTS